MREVRALRLHTSDDLERLVHGEMRGMRPLAQRVDDEGAHAVDERPRLVGNPAAVGEIGKRSDAESKNWPRPMENRDRDELDPAERERSADPRQVDLGNPAAGHLAFSKDVPERLTDV